MKRVNNPPNRKGFLVQLRIEPKRKSITLYEAWDILKEALEDHPDIEIRQAEFRVEPEDHKTSIED